MPTDRTPILIGAGQFTQRDVDVAEAQEPMALMAECARLAAADAGLSSAQLRQLDRVSVVNIFGWHYQNPPGALAAALETHPRDLVYTTLGGNTPQMLVNQTAADIGAGTVELALLAGCETLNTVTRARRAGVQLLWSAGAEGTPTMVGDDRQGTNDHEVTHGLMVPTSIYPLFENALRARYGLSLAAHRQRLGELCSGMTAVAAANPYAWFRQSRSADELMTVTAHNRYIGFPYPKYLNAILDVDQAAAVLMTSVGRARRLGIDESRWVYLHGCGDAHDHWFVSERPNLSVSPAIKLVGEKALAMAGVDIGEIEHFDIYSCFPSAIQIGRDMLGIAADDPRSLTVTGGLPYHGGPGNNYTMHGIATVMDRVRAMPGSMGLVTGLGWYATKHSVGIYGAMPPTRAFEREDPHRYQADIDRQPRAEIVHEPRGRGEIETYTVLHDRDGLPVRGVIVGRLTDGRRFLANTPSDRPLLEALIAREGVGREGTVTSAGGNNQFDPA